MVGAGAAWAIVLYSPSHSSFHHQSDSSVKQGLKWLEAALSLLSKTFPPHLHTGVFTALLKSERDLGPWESSLPQCPQEEL